MQTAPTTTSPLASETSRPLQRDFSAWVEATSPESALEVGEPGFTYADLHQPARLAELTARFHAFVGEREPATLEALKALSAGTASHETESATLIAASSHLSAFVARLFKVEAEVEALRRRLVDDDPVFSFKHEFAKKRVKKEGAGAGLSRDDADRVARIVLLAAGADEAHLGKGSEAEELTVARATLAVLAIDDTARKLAKAGGATWRADLSALASTIEKALSADPRASSLAGDALASVDASAPEHVRAGALAAFALSAIEAHLAHRHRDHHDGVHRWPSLHEPRKLDFQRLVQVRRPDPKHPDLFVGPDDHRRERDGFSLTDRRFSTRQVQNEVDYCIYCHDRDKDSCSKGLRDPKTRAIKPNPLGVALNGCPLEEKISEAHLVRRGGNVLGALALVCVDNPLCPGTGHRICNDCMKACIFQKQEPVNIPQIETATLTDVLSLPWGVEIYGLLTRWNPLNTKLPHPAPLNGRAALVVGLGPAGYTLAHHLARAGFAVAAVDGLKIEPLPVELTGDETHAPRPIKDFAKLCVELDERVLLGFGGVSEYGITVRWDKNFLTLLYLTLSRARRVRIYGGVRFGGTITVDDAWKLGFDHVALAAGAGKPTIIPIKNNLARGIRKASDFLMGLQLTGAYKRSSLANLQVELPAVVIGGGLTAIDTATELLAYYVVQAEKTAERYRALCASRGEAEVEKLFDAAELSFMKRQCEHADAIAAERARAAAEGGEPRLQELLDSWGGVTIAYRKSVLDSPAYRLNHEEVEKSLEEGVRYFENLSPLEAVLDESGHLTSVKLERLGTDDKGGWKPTGEVVELPARTLCVAAGTSPNTTIEKENPGIFALDGRKQYFQAHVATRDEGGAIKLEPSKDLAQAFFTSYAGGERTVSFYGDNHPHYAGSVVKAMASAKVGFEKVAELYADKAPVDEATMAGRRERARALFKSLDEQLVARVHEVKRLTSTIVEIVVKAPLAARNFQPGQFYRLQSFESLAPVVDGVRLNTEGLALTGAWVDRDNGLLSTIVLEMGVSSRLCAMLRPGEQVVLMGPTGAPTEIQEGGAVLLAGGGLGNAVLFSIAHAMKAHGSKVIYFAGYRRGEDLFRQDDIEAHTDQVVWCTDSGAAIEPRRPQDHHFRGNIVQAMVAYAKGELGPRKVELRDVGRIIAIGSDKMMAAVQQARHGVLAPHLDPRHLGIASINSPMQCMMKEICAQCLQKHRDPVTGKEFTVFTCFNQDQDMDKVDFAHLAQRLKGNAAQEKLTNAYLDLLLARAPELPRV